MDIQEGFLLARFGNGSDELVDWELTFEVDEWTEDPDEVQYTITDIIEMGLFRGRE